MSRQSSDRRLLKLISSCRHPVRSESYLWSSATRTGCVDVVKMTQTLCCVIWQSSEAKAPVALYRLSPGTRVYCCILRSPDFEFPRSRRSEEPPSRLARRESKVVLPRGSPPNDAQAGSTVQLPLPGSLAQVSHFVVVSSHRSFLRLCSFIPPPSPRSPFCQTPTKLHRQHY